MNTQLNINIKTNFNLNINNNDLLIILGNISSLSGLESFIENSLNLNNNTYTYEFWLYEKKLNNIEEIYDFVKNKDYDDDKLNINCYLLEKEEEYSNNDLLELDDFYLKEKNDSNNNINLLDTIAQVNKELIEKDYKFEDFNIIFNYLKNKKNYYFMLNYFSKFNIKKDYFSDKELLKKLKFYYLILLFKFNQLNLLQIEYNNLNKNDKQNNELIDFFEVLLKRKNYNLLNYSVKTINNSNFRDNSLNLNSKNNEYNFLNYLYILFEKKAYTKIIIEFKEYLSINTDFLNNNNNVFLYIKLLYIIIFSLIKIKKDESALDFIKKLLKKSLNFEIFEVLNSLLIMIIILIDNNKIRESKNLIKKYYTQIEDSNNIVILYNFLIILKKLDIDFTDVFNKIIEISNKDLNNLQKYSINFIFLNNDFKLLYKSREYKNLFFIVSSSLKFIKYHFNKEKYEICLTIYENIISCYIDFIEKKNYNKLFNYLGDIYLIISYSLNFLNKNIEEICKKWLNFAQKNFKFFSNEYLLENNYSFIRLIQKLHKKNSLDEKMIDILEEFKTLVKNLN